MKQARLENLMLIHVHKNITDTLNHIEVANKFVAQHPLQRKSDFGTFKEKDN